MDHAITSAITCSFLPLRRRWRVEKPDSGQKSVVPQLHIRARQNKLPPVPIGVMYRLPKEPVMSPTSQDGTADPIRVLICNKYTLFREGLKALLQEGIVIEVAGEASTAKEALDQMKRVKPDVILLDATTADLGASHIVRRLKSMNPEAKILILSLDDDELLVERCIKAGAIGSIRRYDSAYYLKSTINRACGRETRAA
jgi:CheY-like chemotaxis protein